MRKNFQFCFCKHIEDNQIPYQKLLINYPLDLFLSTLFLRTGTDDSKDILGLIFCCFQHLFKVRICNGFFSIQPPSYDDNQSIHSTISREPPLGSRSHALSSRRLAMPTASHTGPLISSDVDGRKVVEYRWYSCQALVIVGVYCARLVLVSSGWAVRPSWAAVGHERPAEDGMS